MGGQMDAVTFLKTKTQKRWVFGIFVLIAFQSTLSALTSRYGKGGWWLGDFDAVVCGAWRIGNGLSPYQHPAPCQGLKAADYVYAPQIAYVFDPLVDLLGPWGLHWAYMPILVAVVSVLIWYAVFRPMPGVPLHLRLMGLMAIRGSPLTTGNLGAVLQAAIVLALINLRRWRWLYVAIVITAAMVKPMFMTALIVLLFEQRPWRQRLLAFAGAFAAGVVAVAILMVTAAPLDNDWRNFLTQIVLDQQPGRGIFLALSSLGISENTLPAYIIYAVTAAIIVSAGLIIISGNDLSDQERACIALGIAQMINPRLFEYNFDFYLLYPAMALIVMVSERLSQRGFVILSWVFVGGMTFEFLDTVIGFSFIRPVPHALLICCAVVFGAAWLTLRRHSDTLAAWAVAPSSTARRLFQDVMDGRI